MQMNRPMSCQMSYLRMNCLRMNCLRMNYLRMKFPLNWHSKCQLSTMIPMTKNHLSYVNLIPMIHVNWLEPILQTTSDCCYTAWYAVDSMPKQNGKRCIPHFRNNYIFDIDFNFWHLIRMVNRFDWNDDWIQNCVSVHDWIGNCASICISARHCHRSNGIIFFSKISIAFEHTLNTRKQKLSIQLTGNDVGICRFCEGGSKSATLNPSLAGPAPKLVGFGYEYPASAVTAKTKHETTMNAFILQ